MGIILILLIAVGLAMDSLAVSISGGIVMRPFCMRQALRLAFTMGIFQGGMTLLGWLMGVSFSSYITTFDHWIAFVLLGFLGGKMIYESFEGVEQQGIEPWSKHGIHMLSTCLVTYWFSTMVRKVTPTPSLILLNFRLSPKVG